MRTKPGTLYALFKQETINTNIKANIFIGTYANEVITEIGINKHFLLGTSCSESEQQVRHPAPVRRSVEIGSLINLKLSDPKCTLILIFL